MPHPSILTAETLWDRLSEMENELRFSGRPYPEGTCKFPFKLTGQGFFPGGDGLWRDDSERDQESTGVLPIGGVMFLGNDFGTRESYLKLDTKRYENPPTWHHLKDRIQRAELPAKQAFFTNAIVGLRSAEGAKALDKRAWQAAAAFEAFCREFLDYQIKTLQPRLIVTLGPHARSALNSLEEIGNIALLESPHPYGDFNFSEAKKQQIADKLRTAWKAAFE